MEEVPREIQHFLHPCPLLLTVLDSYYICNACSEDGSGFTYRCVGCDFDMHVECAQRQPTIQSDSEELVQHFTHWHPLQLLVDDTEKKSDHVCKICDKLCSGFDSSSAAYGCEDCDFFVHKSCMNNIPRQINHLCHPSCSLILIPISGRYPVYGRYDRCDGCLEDSLHLAFRCGKCRFQLDVKCATLPTVESSDGNRIQHFAHRHPLAFESKDLGEDFRARCSVCRENCSSDPRFVCNRGTCRFILHRRCAVELRREVHHAFHPQHPLFLETGLSNWFTCEGCNREAFKGLAFSCRKCKFTLDTRCALLPTVESRDAARIQYSAHKHPLALCQGNELSSEVRCRACGENCLLDPCYSCIKSYCNFFLHRKCAVDLQQEIHHPFHPQHPLILLGDLPYRCKVCDEDSSGLAYCCKTCKFLLDLKCALFPTILSKDADDVLHCAHKHPLTLHKSKEFANEARCRGCAKSCSAPCFGCTECNFYLHKTCAVERQEKDIRHPFHPIHPLTLSSPPPHPRHDTFQCSSCLGSDDWNLLRYRCAKCDFELHFDCAKTKLELFKYEDHEHHLTYFGKILAPVKCNICHKDAQTCFFQCLACAFNIHIYCISSTPKLIKHQSHLHPLTVTESPFIYESISPEYADGSDDHEFYCDVCEEKRYKFDSVYYCPDCKFIAEVRCVLSEVLPPLIIAENQSMVEGTVSSSDEENSAIEATIVKCKRSKRVLKEEIEKCRETFKNLEEKLERRIRKLEQLETDNFLYKYHLSHKHEGK